MGTVFRPRLKAENTGYQALPGCGNPDTWVLKPACLHLPFRGRHRAEGSDVEKWDNCDSMISTMY